MAFKRLVVQRVPFLVGFGAIGFALWGASIHNEGVTSVGDAVFELTNEAHSLVWLAAPFVVLSYCIFLGLGGRWWRDLRVDRASRRLKTSGGQIIPFDRIGALSIADGALVAEGVDTPLYSSRVVGRAERRRDALEIALGRRPEPVGSRVTAPSGARFERLVVLGRSTALVWFGVLGLVCLYALMMATYPSLRWLVHAGKWWLWLAAYLVLAYMVFRGLFGAWWHQVRVDREARLLKTMTGTIVPFDAIGPLTVANGELRAEGVAPAIYTSAFAYELALLQVVLDGLLGRGERRRLHRFRRLVVQRSWGLFVFTFVGFALLTAASVRFIVIGGSHEIEYKLLALGGYAVCVAWFRRALFGSSSQHQLLVDPTAGLVRLEDLRIVPLSALGALSIATRTHPYAGRRHRTSDFELRAANIGVIYTSVWSSEDVQLRIDALSTATLQHELRRILEAPQLDGDAFRGGLDPSKQAARLASESPYGRAALDALTKDPDATIRERARRLL